MSFGNANYKLRNARLLLKTALTHFLIKIVLPDFPMHVKREPVQIA